MKHLLLFLVYIICINGSCFKLDKIINLNGGWSFTFMDKYNIFITEKKGIIKSYNLENRNIHTIKHNLNISYSGQGALMDIIIKDKNFWVSYSFFTE